MKIKDLKLFHELKKIGSPYIVGSFVLYSVYDLGYLAKDVDICIETEMSVENLKSFLIDINCKILRETKLGGIKVEYQGFIYDIWRMQDTILNKFDERKVKEGCPTYWFIEGLVFQFTCNIMHCWISPEDDEIYYDAWFESFLEHGHLETALTQQYNVLELDKKARNAIKRIMELIDVAEFDFNPGDIDSQDQGRFDFLGIRNPPVFED